MASFSIVNNIASVNAQASLTTTSLGLNKALTRLSSGLRINQSGDDAAGLAVANQYRSDVAILNQGIRNANDGLSVLQIRDGALQNISTLLDRLATLATQASSSSNGVDPVTLSDEYVEIVSEITRQAEVAQIDDDWAFSVFVSADASGQITTTADVSGVDATALALDTDGWTDATGAQAALSTVTTAIASLGDVQNQVGILQNRLQFAVSLAQSQVVNTRAAESRIRDANIAEESANLTRFNILTQSGIAALAQANQSSASVLALLR
jgi:flagellin